MVTREETYSKAFELKRKALKEKERRYNMMLNSAYSENPRIKELYDTFLGKPGSHKAHEILHTVYTDRFAGSYRDIK